eukprot:TRINITY_DN4595_c0_g1_i6.p1 TRINITY_DN4595_c0_g1~~TRINITY_DN4595_c0_g1_i6.p1  ORF type:complete len:490 (+),score=100.93 TRINITY_DN4595_c0_g1_i6:132-1601(+)
MEDKKKIRERRFVDPSEEERDGRRTDPYRNEERERVDWRLEDRRRRFVEESRTNRSYDRFDRRFRPYQRPGYEGRGRDLRRSEGNRGNGPVSFLDTRSSSPSRSPAPSPNTQPESDLTIKPFKSEEENSSIIPQHSTPSNTDPPLPDNASPPPSKRSRWEDDDSQPEDGEVPNYQSSPSQEREVQRRSRWEEEEEGEKIALETSHEISQLPAISETTHPHDTTDVPSPITSISSEEKTSENKKRSRDEEDEPFDNSDIKKVKLNSPGSNLNVNTISNTPNANPNPNINSNPNSNLNPNPTPPNSNLNPNSNPSSGANTPSQVSTNVSVHLLPSNISQPVANNYGVMTACRSVLNFEKDCTIGQGAYGYVFRAKDRATGEVVALKKVKMEKEKDGFPLTSIREVRILMQCKHINIVFVKEVVVGKHQDEIFVVMEYVEHDLKGLLEDVNPFTVSEVKCLLNQLLLGMEYLHNNWILHRDIKTSNRVWEIH